MLEGVVEVLEVVVEVVLGVAEVAAAAWVLLVVRMTGALSTAWVWSRREMVVPIVAALAPCLGEDD